MIFFDRWTVDHLQPDVRRLSELWIKLQDYPTLFTDETRGDMKHWISAVMDEDYVWYVVQERDVVVGLMYFQLLGDKADGHVAFFDRKPAEKKELIKFFCRFLFETLDGLNKIVTSVPEIYHATWRLVKAVGFKWEGTLREDIKIGGKRINVHLYGLLRSEVYELPQGQSQRSQLNAERHSAAPSGTLQSASARAER